MLDNCMQGRFVYLQLVYIFCIVGCLMIRWKELGSCEFPAGMGVVELSWIGYMTDLLCHRCLMEKFFSHPHHQGRRFLTHPALAVGGTICITNWQMRAQCLQPEIKEPA